MEPIDKKEINFLKNQIIKRYNELKKLTKTESSDTLKTTTFSSYLNQYWILSESFDEIVGKGLVTNNSLRKLFYYGNKVDQLKVNPIILDSYYRYFSGMSRKEFNSGGGRNRVVIKVYEEFETEFTFWKEVDQMYFLSYGFLKKVLSLLDISSFDSLKRAFVFLNSVHFGDKSMHSLLKINKSNKSVLPHLFNLAMHGGCRDGWRAEYFLSQLDDNILIYFIYQEEKNVIDVKLKEKIERIRTKNVITYLQSIKSEEGRLKEFAVQVLKQIEE